LTGCRREEVGGMADSEINVEKRLWSIPRERTKNNNPHNVPLADTAMALLQNHPRRIGRDLLFGDTMSRPFQGWSWNSKEINKRLAEARQVAGDDKAFAPLPPGSRILAYSLT
jgi:integrase